MHYLNWSFEVLSQILSLLPLLFNRRYLSLRKIKWLWLWNKVSSIPCFCHCTTLPNLSAEEQQFNCEHQKDRKKRNTSFSLKLGNRITENSIKESKRLKRMENQGVYSARAELPWQSQQIGDEGVSWKWETDGIRLGRWEWRWLGITKRNKGLTTYIKSLNVSDILLNQGLKYD